MENTLRCMKEGNLETSLIWREGGTEGKNGMIHFIPDSAAAMSDTVLSHPDLGGIHFTVLRKYLRIFINR